MILFIRPEEVEQYKTGGMLLPCVADLELVFPEYEMSPEQIDDFINKYPYYSNNDSELMISGDFIRGKEEPVLKCSCRYLKNKKKWVVMMHIRRPTDVQCPLSGKARCCLPPIRYGGGDMEIHFQFACHATRCADAMLVIDLGNTRSCALVCDDVQNITHRSGMYLERLPMEQYFGRDIKQSDIDIGIFNSYVSFSQSESLFSFTRAGYEGLTISRILNRADICPGVIDYYLSSPKRFFWDNDCNSNHWKLLDDNVESQENNGADISMNPTAAMLAEKEGNCWEMGTRQDVQLSRSGILSSMLIEIMEQAETYLNSPFFYNRAPIPRLLSHVCITFPAAWNQNEVELYKQVLQNAVDCYVSKRCDKKQAITLDVSCDEATAVTMCYAYSEIDKFGGMVDLWLSTIGRRSRVHQEENASGDVAARLAVIDVGGGTSDLVIVEVKENRGNGRSILNVNRLYKDGTTCAGDMMQLSIIKAFLIDKIGELLAEVYYGDAVRERRESFVSNFRNYLNDFSEQGNGGQFNRTFWYNLAIGFLDAVKCNKNELDLKPFNNDLVMLCQFLQDRNRIEGSASDFTQTERKLSISEKEANKLNSIIQKHFKKTARQFGAAIYAFDADLVLLAGKTTEFPAVSGIFRKYCYLPNNRFVTMWDYNMGNWCQLISNGRIADSKYTTALGAAVYAIANYNFPIQNTNLSIQSRTAEGMNDGNCAWGIYDRQYRLENTLLKPGHRFAKIEFANKPVLLARRRFEIDDTEAPISYELRFKPDYRKEVAWDIKFKSSLPGMKKHFIVKVPLDRINLKPGDFIIQTLDETKGFGDEKIVIHIGETEHGPAIIGAEGKFADSSKAQPSDFILRLKPRQRRLSNDVSVELELVSDAMSRAKIEIVNVEGFYDDGTKVSKDDLELRIRTCGEEEGWLDGGLKF